MKQVQVNFVGNNIKVEKYPRERKTMKNRHCNRPKVIEAMKMTIISDNDARANKKETEQFFLK
jgi:hypothetical protein